VTVTGTKRHRLLCLLAAYADAGVCSPSMRELLGRLDLKNAMQVDALLRALQRDGLVRVRWGEGEHERNVYELRLDEHEERERW
jgi:hypothetical protein